MAKLETIILQDSFGRTARKAAEWVQKYKPYDSDEEENRQIMLRELAAYSDFDFGEKWEDSVPLPGGLRFRTPSVIENLVAEVITLAAGAYRHRAAVQDIQDQYFAGHPILFLDIEAGLNEAIKMLEDGIETFNAYLKTRAELFETEWAADEEENDGIASAIPGERQGRLSIDINTIRGLIADHKGLDADWVKDAKDEAKADSLKDVDEGKYRHFVGSLVRQLAGLSDDLEAVEP